MVVEANLVFAGLDALLRDGLTTGARVVELLDEVEHRFHRGNVRVGAIEGAPFFVDGSCAEDAWEELVGDANAGVGLAVLQQYIIAWIVLLDE